MYRTFCKRAGMLFAVLGVAVWMAVSPATVAADALQTEKQVDVWILAGQSNAAGNSYLSQDVYGREDITYRELLQSEDPRNAEGYSNVLYYGVTNVLAADPLPASDLEEVKLGQGAAAYYIGPELGMANVLSESYSDSAPAAIIKYAVNGTFLCDFEGAEQQTQLYGTWASPTMTARATEAGIALHENNGVLYERLLSVVEAGFAALKEQGYTPCVKGYVWMQGEADACAELLSSRYEDSLKTFITDLRSDVAWIAGDETAALRPLVMGKICPSGEYGAYISAVRAAQDGVAAQLENVYLVDTEDLRIHNADGSLNGADKWHFNAEDMYQLGKRFMRTAAGMTAYDLTFEVGFGGSIQRSPSGSVVYAGDEITMQVNPSKGYVLDHVLFNGVEVFPLEDGSYHCVAQGDVRIEVAFAEKKVSGVMIASIVAGGVVIVVLGVIVGRIIYKKCRRKED